MSIFTVITSKTHRGSLSWNLLSTRSKKIHKIVQLGKDSNNFLYWTTSFIGWLGSHKIIQKIFRKLDFWLVPGGMFDHLFNQYKPDIVLATDMQDLRVQELSDTSLIREAKRKGIFIIAITDTNVDPTIADYPIPANDDAISSVRYILDKVSETVKNAKN